MRIRLTTSRIKIVDVVIEQPIPFSAIYERIGFVEMQLLADGKVLLTNSYGAILRDGDGRLWVHAAEEVPPAYMAASLDNLHEISRRRNAMSQTSCLPRSQQYRHVQTVAEYDTWLQQHDPQCLSEASFWEELQSEGS